MKNEGKIECLINDLERTTEDIFSFEELKNKLMTKEKLVIKYGVDVTAPFLHLGHAVNLWMMRRLQEEGHKVIFLIGDTTTKIGDPTGKSQTRPIIADVEIQENTTKYIRQVSNILITDEPSVFEVRRNSEWYDKLELSHFISLLSYVTHSRLISRNMFQKRIEEGREIYTHELVYPILQGYDSVMLESDLTIVGSDQLFNENIGRFFQAKFNQDPQVIITSKITPGLDGKEKQSKSLGNYVAIADNSKDKFGKVMSLPDELITQWMEVYTDISLDKIKSYEKKLKNQSINPRNLKLELAEAIVEKYHNLEIAKQEKDWFINIFSKRDFPEDAPIIQIKKGEYTIIEILKKSLPTKSNSELRRLIQQGGFKLNNEKIIDPFVKTTVRSQEIYYIRVGKRNFFKLLASGDRRK